MAFLSVLCNLLCSFDSKCLEEYLQCSYSTESENNRRPQIYLLAAPSSKCPLWSYSDPFVIYINIPSYIQDSSEREKIGWKWMEKSSIRAVGGGGGSDAKWKKSWIISIFFWTTSFTKVTSLGHITSSGTNLDWLKLTSESRPRLNFINSNRHRSKILTKHQLQNLAGTSISKSRPNLKAKKI